MIGGEGEGGRQEGREDESRKGRKGKEEIRQKKGGGWSQHIWSPQKDSSSTTNKSGLDRWVPVPWEFNVKQQITCEVQMNLDFWTPLGIL